MKARLYDDLVYERKDTSVNQQKETEQHILVEKVQFANWTNNEITKKYLEMLKVRRNVLIEEAINGCTTLNEIELRCKLTAVKQLTEQITGVYYNEGQPDKTT